MNIKIVSATIVGVTAGLLVQPTFPENLLFYWHQIVTIGIIGVPDFVTTGLEWRSIGIFGLFKSFGVMSFLIFASIVLLILFRKQIDKSVYGWFWLLIPLFLLSLSSIRNMEHLIPFVILAVAILFQSLPKERMQAFFKARTLESLFIGIILSVSALVWIIYPLALIFDLQRRALPLTMFQDEARIIETETNEAFVINTRWDAFPMLFYYTDNTYFLSGLDPAFLYIQNPELYKGVLELRDTGYIDLLLGNITTHEDIYVAEFITDEISGPFLSLENDLTLISSDQITALYIIEPR